MPEKVLVFSRFPKALMQRIGERFDLLDAAGKPPHDVFPADQLSGIRAMITAGGTPLRGDMMDKLPSLGAIVMASGSAINARPSCSRRSLGHDPVSRPPRAVCGARRGRERDGALPVGRASYVIVAGDEH